jgi:hypothetical protein
MFDALGQNLLRFIEKFTVYEMMQLYTKQCSLYPTRVLARHFMPIKKKKKSSSIQDKPTGHLLTYL